MSTALSSVPAARRRRSALVAAAFALVLLAAGIMPWAMPAPGVIRFVAAVVALAGLFAALVAVGLLRSVRVVPVGEARSQVVPAAGGGCGGGCQCGHNAG